MWSYIITNLRVQIAWDQQLVQPSCAEQNAGIPRCSFQEETRPVAICTHTDIPFFRNMHFLKHF